MKEKGIWSFFWTLDKCYDITYSFAIIYLLLFFLILPYQSCWTLITKLLWSSCFRRFCNAVRIVMVVLKHTKVIIKLIVIFVGWLIGCRRLSVSHPSTPLFPTHLLLGIFKTTWLQLFKRWIGLSTGKITIHWITQLVLLVFIRWIVIYPVDSAIHRLNNWGLNVTWQWRAQYQSPNMVKLE